jgi:hypothetical protein
MDLALLEYLNVAQGRGGSRLRGIGHPGRRRILGRVWPNAAEEEAGTTDRNPLYIFAEI